MDERGRFMSELFRIVNGALRLDTDKVRNYTAYLADRLEKDGDATSARRLRKMLEETDHQLRPARAVSLSALPVDVESRFPLIERVDLRSMVEAPLFLSQDQWDVVNEFLSVAKSSAQIEAREISGALSFLVYGPPGTGKSRLARHMARELDLELFVARLDGLISSFLGSTSKNIRALFDFAARSPCILFLDEFDAIAKLRGDTQELGELKRVVNSFLQNLDTIGRQSIIIAATNHELLLDAAVWRRFSYRLQLALPDAMLRKEMWMAFGAALDFSNRDLELVVDLTEGFSGSDIQEVCLRLRRREVTTRAQSRLHDAFRVIQNMAQGEGEQSRFVARLRGKDATALVQTLRERNGKLYTFSAVGELTGLSKSSVHRLA
jgi:SpoVK/Ycf46/Vps4 family AAA+-type ATPase